MSEESLYEEGVSNWRITRDWARFGDRTNAIGHITSVVRQRAPASKSGPMLVLAMGFVMLAGGAFYSAVAASSGGANAMACPGLVAFAGAVVVWVGWDAWKKAIPQFSLRITTSASELQLVLCSSEQQMREVEAAIERAVSMRR